MLPFIFVLASLAHASYESSRHASVDLMQKAQEAQSRAVKTAKDAFEGTHSDEHIVGSSSSIRRRVQPFKAMLLHYFGRPARTQSNFVAEALNDVQMMATESQLDSLEIQLALAVKLEEYAEAAKLRDELKAAKTANPMIALSLERQNRLRAHLITALSPEAPMESKAFAIQAITELAMPPLPAQGAEDALHRILLETSDSVQDLAHIALGLVWSSSGNDDIDTRLRHGLSCIAARDMKNAVETLTVVIDKKPEFAQGWHGRATAYFFSGEYELCIEDCQQALELKPRHFGCLSLMGGSLVKQGDVVEGLKYLKLAEKVYPRLVQSQYGQTMASLEERLRVSPISSRVQSFVAFLGRALKSKIRP
jgi:tetratricopeptide (TPR) repeat protein